jgi:hypothetical protein
LRVGCFSYEPVVMPSAEPVAPCTGTDPQWMKAVANDSRIVLCSQDTTYLTLKNGCKQGLRIVLDAPTVRNSSIGFVVD